MASWCSDRTLLWRASTSLGALSRVIISWRSVLNSSLSSSIWRPWSRTWARKRCLSNYKSLYLILGSLSSSYLISVSLSISDSFFSTTKPPKTISYLVIHALHCVLEGSYNAPHSQELALFFMVVNCCCCTHEITTIPEERRRRGKYNNTCTRKERKSLSH